MSCWPPQVTGQAGVDGRHTNRREGTNSFALGAVPMSVSAMIVVVTAMRPELKK